MAAELVGGALLSSLFQTLFNKLASREMRSFFRGLKVNEGLLRKLKTMLWSANQVLNDAEEKQLANPDVREWLFELKDTIYDAEDVLDVINYRALRYELKSKSRSKRLQSFLASFSTFDEGIERKIEEIHDRLKYIVEQKDLLGLREGVTNRLSQRLPAPLADESCVYGRNDDKEKIIKLLLSDNESSGGKISVIPIVGMGGIGKTTLAQLVYEDSRVKSQFQIRSWVTVSDESDISIIARKILEEIISKKSETEGLYQLQCKLKEALINQRFLFVLDDVWNENYEHWEVLMSSFRSGANGSKIIVTTRSDIVAKKMGNVPTHHLETVSDDDCWKLLVEHVFNNASLDAYEDLLVIAREVIKKCKGVPLAVKSLAGLLRSVTDPEEWKRILNSDIWELQLQGNQSNNILPSLWLSYHYLPFHLKRCFAFCSIFPKDYGMNESEKEKIILLWMAEGLLQPGNRGKQVEDVGNEYFQDLVSRSLFQPLKQDKSTILMHDLTHDLAVFVSGEFSFRLDDGDETNFSGKTRHFSSSIFKDWESFAGSSVATSLRSFLQLPLSHMRRRNAMCQRRLLLPVGGCLRALCFANSYFTVLPDSIGNLKHLRYLDFSNSNIENIPNTLCSLHNLQTLLLSWCMYLTQLPSDMGSLINLRHLDIKEVPLKKMPPKMSNLKDLQTLSDFIVGKKGGSSIKELGGLRYLSRELEISDLENVNVVGDVWEANLKEKKYLSKLVYRWNYDHDSGKDREVLDALQPHPNVKEIVISCYGAEAFSNWVGHCSYTNMVTVQLYDCFNCHLLPPLGQLPSLQNLKIWNCRGVERIGAEFYCDGSSSNIKPYFRSLKSLEFQYMSEWQEWSFPDQGREDGGCFPSLEHLSIWDCPKLNVCLPDYFPSLKTFELMGNDEIDVLPGIQQMERAFPSLERLSIENCLKLEMFLLSNFPSNLKGIFLSSSFRLSSDDGCSISKAHLCLKIKVCENIMTFPGGLLPTTLTCLSIKYLGNLRALNGECFQHLTCLEELRIVDCEELQCFPGEMLPTSLTTLHLELLPKLEDLGKGIQHLISLKDLKIVLCKNLRCLSENGLPTSLTSLYVSFSPSVEEPGKGFFQHITSLKDLSIEYCENLQSSLEENGLPTSLTYLRISGFPNLRNLNGMDFQHLRSLKELKIHGCGNLECLPEEGLPSSLSSLEIVGCPLVESRCQRGTGQDWPKISLIPHLNIGIKSFLGL